MGFKVRQGDLLLEVFKVQGSEESMELQLNEHSECHGRQRLGKMA